MKPEAQTDIQASAAKAKSDYSKASPEAIRADIEKTRAHMDETLALLGRKIRPNFFKSGRKIAATVTAVILGGAGLFMLFRALPRKALPRSLLARKRKQAVRVNIRTVRGIFDRILVMRTLAAAARKGKPAVFIVQPRKF